MTEPLSVKAASLLLDRDGDICDTAVPLKTTPKLKTSSRDDRLPQIGGSQGRFMFAMPCVTDCRLQDTMDCRLFNRISDDAVIINPAALIMTRIR
ncbi:MAG TPA: hypothetical protein VFC29_09725 [Candidatus Limnocylindrales bacterium]|jgi:hypothetical protein|nr:hypothetical protein [Candidatus Limnocylindrales bacterium]